MAAIDKALEKVLLHGVIEDSLMEEVMEEILHAKASQVAVAGLMVAMKMRGEHFQEIACAAHMLRTNARDFFEDDSFQESGDVLVDTCGTGGDGLRTLNISTISAIVVASCGVKVAKHGNRAVSGVSGSADLIEDLGIDVEADPVLMRKSLATLHIGFLYAPMYHPSLKHVASIRRDLGIRTFFNLLGPLCNPAPVTHCLLGVSEPWLVPMMSRSLKHMGKRAAWVVHGQGGIDEISTQGPTQVCILKDGVLESKVLFPQDFGMEPVGMEELKIQSREEGSLRAMDILQGKIASGRAGVLINAGATLLLAGKVQSLHKGALLAKEVLDSGKAWETVLSWRELMR